MKIFPERHTFSLSITAGVYVFKTFHIFLSLAKKEEIRFQEIPLTAPLTNVSTFFGKFDKHIEREEEEKEKEDKPYREGRLERKTTR